MTHWCVECRDGGHDNHDDDVRMTLVRDPKTKQLIRHAYICREHRAQYLADGYQVWTMIDGKYQEV